MESWEDEANELLEQEERGKQQAATAAVQSETKQATQRRHGGRGLASAAAPAATSEVDSLAERLRQQKLVEDADRRLMDDLFAGCDRPADYEGPAATSAVKQTKDAAAKTRRPPNAATADFLENLSLRSYKDCEDFALKLGTAIQQSPAKSPAWLRFLDLVISDGAAKMELKDLVSLKQKLLTTIAAREKQAKQLAEKKKKPNDTGSAIKNYRDEIDLIYGDLSSEEEGEEEVGEET